MQHVLIEAQYLPPVPYFMAIADADEITIEKHEHFVKQTFRNRCYINTAHGKHLLTIPLTAKHGKALISEVRIDYAQKWLNNHWRTIQSAYGKAPYFEHYGDALHDLLFQRHTHLYDLNFQLLTLCLGWLRWTPVISESSRFMEHPPAQVKDLRNCINAKKPGTGNNYYSLVRYNQIFGNMFVEGLSLIDLIFCEGPEASHIIRSGRRR